MPKQPQTQDPNQTKPAADDKSGRALKPGEQQQQVAVDDSIRSTLKEKFLSRLFKEEPEATAKEDSGNPEAKAAEEKPAKPAKQEKKAPTEAKVEDEPAKEPEAAPEPAPLIDEEKLAKAITAGNEGLVAALKKSQTPAQPAAEPIPELVAKKRHIYDKLSEIYPQKYPNQTEAMSAFARAEAKYIAKWEDENGEQFNPDDDRHNAWYDKHMPKIDDEDLEEAKIQVRLERELTKIRSESKDEVESVRREIRERDFKSEATSLKDESYAPILAAIDSELAGTPIEELSTKDKLANKIVRSEVDRIFPFIQEIARLERRIVDYDASNPDHKAIHGLLTGIEETISSVPANKQVRDGKKWVSRKEWSKLSQKQRDNHWIVTEQDLRSNVLSYVGGQAKQKYNELRELLDLPPAGSQSTKSTAKTVKPLKTEDAPAFLSDSKSTTESQSPSIRTSTQINAPASKGTPAAKTGRELFMDRLVSS